MAANSAAQIELIPPFGGGYFNYRILCCPAPSPIVQEDNSSFLSPSLYRQFVLPIDRQILSNFQTPYFHTHSSGAHVILDDLLTSSEVKALILLGSTSVWPAGRDSFPSYHRIQEAGKSLYILAVGNPREEELLMLQELSPQGLCIFFQAQDIGTGHRIVEKLEAAWEI